MSTRTDLAEQPVRCEVEMELLRRQRELLAYMEDKLAQPSANWLSVQRQIVLQVASSPGQPLANPPFGPRWCRHPAGHVGLSLHAASCPSEACPAAARCGYPCSWDTSHACGTRDSLKSTATGCQAHGKHMVAGGYMLAGGDMHMCMHMCMGCRRLAAASPTST